MKELNYSDLYNRYRKLPRDKIELLIQDIQAEMRELGERVTSDGFKRLDDSSNNLKYSVLIQILEEKASE